MIEENKKIIEERNKLIKSYGEREKQNLKKKFVSSFQKKFYLFFKMFKNSNIDVKRIKLLGEKIKRDELDFPKQNIEFLKEISNEKELIKETIKKLSKIFSELFNNLILNEINELEIENFSEFLILCLFGFFTDPIDEKIKIVFKEKDIDKFSLFFLNPKLFFPSKNFSHSFWFNKFELKKIIFKSKNENQVLKFENIINNEFWKELIQIFNENENNFQILLFLGIMFEIGFGVEKDLKKLLNISNYLLIKEILMHK